MGFMHRAERVVDDTKRSIVTVAMVAIGALVLAVIALVIGVRK
jgi:hypothetical protein